jgi:hypothetical protein
LTSATVLSLIWHIPVRAGLLFVSLDTLILSLGLIAHLMLLATLAHPAIAVTFAAIFNASLFYEGQLWAKATIHSGSSSWTLLWRACFSFFIFSCLWCIPSVRKPMASTPACVSRKANGNTWSTAWVTH